MQGLGGLLCLATVAIEALLSVMAAALSGFGLFFRVSFRWGHDDLLRIVMSSIPAYMKETMSHLASISKRQTRGEDAPAPPSYKPFMMNGFHGVSSENPHQCLLKFMFGKARTMRDLEASLPAYQGRGRRPKAPWQSVRAWRTSRAMDAWTRLTVRDGEKGPVDIEMVKHRVQTRLERKRPGPQEWLVVTRRPLADENGWEAQASRDATDHDTRYRYSYYLTPTQIPASGLE